MLVGEALRFSFQALRANKIRTILTALGLVIGNASVILVVTISLTSRDYILEQIRGVGSNLIMAYYEAGSQTSYQVEADFVKWSDVEAVRSQLGDRIVAATGVVTNYDRMVIQGKEQDVQVLGSDSEYKRVRNLQVMAGRFLDASDVALRQKVALLTEKMAKRIYGGQQASIGKMVKVHGIQFIVVGTFRERISTFGLSELGDETVLIPITVMRYFAPFERIDPMYLQARRTEDVEPLTEAARHILESRHRAGARYRVQNLTAILDAAKKIALVLTLVLVMVSAIALVISGIGIMNIMLVTVTERTREIGLRMAVGAARKDILQQFLLEAVLISLSGGFLGILLGVTGPLVAGYLLESVQVPIQVPISWMSILVAFGVSCVVGLVFGLLPASRAARLNPTEALRYE
jgi:putative ABC transport system permease protein